MIAGSIAQMYKYCFLDINECASQPCQNSGQCADRVNGYTCTCADGYAGTNCELSRYISNQSLLELSLLIH